jgi:hypothetical protein
VNENRVLAMKAAGKQPFLRRRIKWEDSIKRTFLK